MQIYLGLLEIGMTIDPQYIVEEGKKKGVYVYRIWHIRLNPNLQPPFLKNLKAGNYEENGVCKYSERCQFAHSLDELRDVERHPRYKTEICKNFLENRFCKYGKRCCFLHVGEQRDEAAPAFCLASNAAMEIVFQGIWDDKDGAIGADKAEKSDAAQGGKTSLGNSLGGNHALVWTKNPVFYIEDKHKKYYESSAQHRAPGEPVLPVCE